MRLRYLPFFIACLLITACQTKHFEKQKPKIVYVDMVADLFHPGHVAFLKQAKAQGDFLIVGLLGDEEAAGYKRPPIMTLSERAIMVRSCRYVDEVVENCPLAITTDFIDDYGIDVVVHGDDYNAQSIKTYYQAAVDRGILKIVPYTPGVSTSDIIQRILSKSPGFYKKKIETGSPTPITP